MRRFDIADELQCDVKPFGSRPARTCVGELPAQALGVCGRGFTHLTGHLDGAEDADSLTFTYLAHIHFYFGMSVKVSCAERATAASVKGKTRGVIARQSSS